jgi:tetratricopeptide (TPR) repeat protein
MPIASFTSQEAFANYASRNESRWPDGRYDNQRLSGFVDVALRPTFTFDASDKIMTLGSCFAREIEKHLNGLGFDLPALAIEIPANERASSVANDIFNKYTVHSIENELRWAIDGLDIPPQDYYLNVGTDLWHDPQLGGNVVPASLERVIERRGIVARAMSQLPACKVIVITLGLGESWYDTLTNTYLNTAPPREALDRSPRRYRLDILGHDDILESLERIHSLLTRHGHPDFKMLLTVSPVPFKATFSGEDAVAANTYSKSVQRAAAEAFVRRHGNVNYFPSYEIVTLTHRHLAYELDNIHVSRALVARIMDRVLSAYVPTLAVASDGVDDVSVAKTRIGAPSLKALHAQGSSYLRQKDYAGAVTVYSSLLFRFGEQISPAEQADVRVTLGVALLRAKDTEEGVKQLELAKKLDSKDARISYKLGLGLARLKRHDEAITHFRLAVAMNPTVPDYAWRLGRELILCRQRDEGIGYLHEALKLDSQHAGALAALKKMRLL